MRKKKMGKVIGTDRRSGGEDLPEGGFPMTFLYLFLFLFLIGLLSFCASAEYVLGNLRPSQIRKWYHDGQKKKAADDVHPAEEYSAAIQKGTVMALLGLGWLGNSAAERWIKPLFAATEIPFFWRQAFSFLAAFFLLASFVFFARWWPGIVIGNRFGQMAPLFRKPLNLLLRVPFPFSRIFGRSVRMMGKSFGIGISSKRKRAHSEEDLRLLLSESLRSGEINPSEYKYVTRIFDFDNRIAREIMIPRTEIVCFQKNAPLREILKTVHEEGYTRYPVAEGNKDRIIGFVNIKEVLTDCIHNHCPEENPLLPYIKPILRVMETTPVQTLLVKMQKQRIPIAIVLDEYGGTAGMVTVEDILEEIVGEIHDEFDADEIPFVRQIKDRHYVLDAKMLIEEVNQLLGTDLDDDEADTLGGWLLTRKYNIKKGDEIEQDGYIFRVLQMEGRHLQYIEAFPRAEKG